MSSWLFAVVAAALAVPTSTPSGPPPTTSPSAGTRGTSGTSAAIVEVVVYPKSARVTRRVEVTCGPGVVASFPGLPGAADPGSFRAHAPEANVQGLRWEARTRSPAAAGRAAALERQLRALEPRLEAARQRLVRIEGAGPAREHYFATAEQLISKQMTGGRPDLRAWSTALDTVLRVQLEAEQGRAAARRQLRTLEGQRDQLAAQRRALGEGASHDEYRAEVTLDCASGRATATVSLIYMVGGAGWTPSYEARTRDDAAQTELSIQATVQQRTGEDWRAARLVLSTALPREEATPPALRPLLVRTGSEEDEGRRLVTRSEEIAHAAGAVTGPAATTGTRVQAAAQGLSVQMVLPQPPLVPGDGRPVRLLVSRTRQRATILLRAAPRLTAQVFRVADLVNDTPFPLLPGPIDVYRGGSFISRDQLAETPARGRLSVTLGLEPRISVRRLVRESVHERGLLGADRQQRYAYTYDLRSHLPGPVQVELVDQVPVSELADVRVVLDPSTTPAHKLDAREGLIRWPVQLPPGVERHVQLAFHVDIPGTYPALTSDGPAMVQR
jgi:uncharacterized protein (TIGR02231 family)